MQTPILLTVRSTSWEGPPSPRSVSSVTWRLRSPDDQLGEMIFVTSYVFRFHWFEFEIRNPVHVDMFFVDIYKYYCNKLVLFSKLIERKSLKLFDNRFI